MAFRTDALDFVYAAIRQTAIGIKAKCAQVKTECAAGSVTSSRILDLYIDLQQAKANLSDAADTPGIAAYAQTQVNDPAYDVVAEFTAMQNALTGAIGWIGTNFPQSGGFLLAKSFSGTTIIDRTFTSAQTAAFQTQLQGVIDAIA